MSEIFARSLSGKAIVGIDGTDYGTLYTITVDPKSGTLRDLVVDSGKRSSSPITSQPDDDGKLHIPVSRIETVKDQIVVHTGD